MNKRKIKMKLIINFLLAMFLTVSIASAQKIEMKYTESGFKAIITGFKINLQNTESLVVISSQGRFTALDPKSDYSIDAYEFYAAVPDAETYDFSVERLAMQFRGYYDLRADSAKAVSYQKLKAEISPIGKYRGSDIVKIKLSPINYNPVTRELFSADTLIFTISYNAENYQSKIPRDDIFPDLINFSDAEYFKRHLANVPRTQEAAWYIPGKSYAKLSTFKDGIAKATAAEIIAAEPALNGLSIDDIALYHKGESVPMFIRSDDKVFDASDEIFFFGSRPKGDTTYYAHYADRTAFYITSGNSSSIETYASPTITNSNLDKVSISQHFEKDKVYENGVEFMRTDISPSEGWFWGRMSIMKESEYYELVSSFSAPIFFEVADEPLKMKVHYRSLEDSVLYDDEQTGFERKTVTRNELHLFINGNVEDKHVFNGMLDGEFEFDFEPNNSLPGENDVTLRMFELYEHTNGRAALDYITLDGKVLPRAYDGILRFTTDLLEEHTAITVRGFRTKDVNALIRKVGSDHFEHFAKTETERGIDYQVGISRGGFKSIIIDDRHFSTKTAGIGIGTYFNGEYDFKNFLVQTEAIAYLKSLPDNAFVVFTKDTATEIAGELKTILRSEGIEEINVTPIGASIVAAFIKGKELYIDSEINSNVVCKVSGFIVSSNGNSFTAKLKLNAGNNYEVILEDSKSTGISPVESVHITDLRSNSHKAEAIFISHADFIDEAERLAGYRRKTQGINIEVVDIEDVYKEYNFGIASAHAIKDFLRDAYNNWQEPKVKYLTLIGDASWDIGKKMENSISENFVPTFGYPPSDYWYGLIDGNDLILTPEIMVGRLPVHTPEEAKNVIDKLIAYDSIPPRPWMKEFLLLTGGVGKLEIESFYYEIKDNLPPHIVNGTLGGDTTMIKKKEYGATTESQASEIRAAINKGAIWTNFLGHASAETFDLDGWDVQKLNNKDRYGVLTTLSCNTGAFAAPTVKNCRNEGYLLEKDKGFISAIGATTFGFVKEHRYATQKMMESLNNRERIYRRMGDIFYFGKSKLYNKLDDPNYKFHIYTQYQFSMLGDPLTKIRIADESELFLLGQDIRIESEDGTGIILEKDDKTTISGHAYNNGFCQDQPVTLLLKRTFQGKTEEFTIEYPAGICRPEAFSFDLPISGMAGTHSCKIIIDPNEELNDYDRSNNFYAFSFEVFREGLLPVEPLENMTISRFEPKFRVINPFSKLSEFSYEFEIVDAESMEVLYKSDAKDIVDDIVSINWLPKLTLQEGTYIFRAHYTDILNATISSTLNLHFYAADTAEDSYVMRSASNFKKDMLNKMQLRTVKGKLKIKLDSSSVDFKMLSFLGRDEHLNRVTIEVGEHVFVDRSWMLGFNVAYYPGIKSAAEPFATRFNTWGEKPDWREDSAAIKFVEFIRDSVPENSYFFAATCQSSFRMFGLHQKFRQDLGSLDSMRYYMNRYGAVLIDSVKGDDPTLNDLGWLDTYVFAGWKGAEPTQAFENTNPNGDSVTISGSLPIYEATGYVTSGQIGPALNWSLVEVLGDINYDMDSIEVEVYGYRGVGGEPQLIYASSNIGEIDISDLDAREFPYISIKASMRLVNFNLNEVIDRKHSYFSSFKCLYEPLPELAVYDSELKVNQSDFLRGEDMTLSYKIKNLSHRTDFAGEYSLKINDTEILRELNLRADESLTVDNEPYETDALLVSNTLQLFANSSSEPEQYDFNNFAKLLFSVRPDTVKPTIKMFYRDTEVTEGTFLPVQPDLVIELYDNSPLAITSDEAISLRINGYYYENGSTLADSTEFESMGKTKEQLKARLFLRPDTLRFEDNLFRLYAQDAEGNRDTVEIMTYAKLYDAELVETSTYPNPTEYAATFKFEYLAPNPNATAMIKIFDIAGRMLRRIESEIYVGSNSIAWDGRDDSGSSLASGTYYFIIETRGNLYSEPVRGGFVIAR